MRYYTLRAALIAVTALVLGFLAGKAIAEEVLPCTEQQGGALECAQSKPTIWDRTEGAVLGLDAMPLPLGNTKGKAAALSYTHRYFREMDTPKWLVWRATVGAWNGNNYFNSSYTGFASLQTGVELQLPYFYAHLLNGPAIISRTDEYLGTHFQLHTTAGIGFEGDDLRLGVTYSHFSNGGLGKPNRGRDYTGVELGFKF